MVQLSHPYTTTGKTITLTCASKVMSLLFNMLSRFVITFLPRSKCLLIEKEEEKFVKGKVDRIIPWYVWPLLFIGAAIVGLFMWKHKGWFSMIV